MPTRIQAPDGSVVEFPDGMDDKAISGAMGKLYPKPAATSPTPAPQPGFLQRLGQTVNPMNMARSVGTAFDALAGPGPMVANAVDTGMNALGEGATPTQAAFSSVPIANDLVRGNWRGAAGQAAGMAAVPLAAQAAGGLAEPLVKSALRLPGKAESFGATPARAVLEDTSGVRPSTIARTGRETIGEIKPQMESLVSKATNPVDLAPARAKTADALALAARQGNKLVHGQVEPMDEALQRNRVTGAPYPPQLSPSEALDLKRGFGGEFPSYNPDIHESSNAVARDVYGQLRRGIHASAPGAEELDQRMQSLIPAIHRAETMSRNAGLAQSVLGRVAARTGGMLPAMLGYHEGGIPGAMAGLIGSEAMGSPVPLMTAARTLHGVGENLPTLSPPLQVMGLNTEAAQPSATGAQPKKKKEPTQ